MYHATHRTLYCTTRLIAVCLTATLISAPASADWIRLGSWNIEKLGQSGEETGPKPVAEAIHLSGVDILAMQEVYDNDGDNKTKTNTQLAAAFEILDGIPGQTWKDAVLPNRSKSDKSQLVAIAWNTERVTKIKPALRLDIDRLATEWDRHPHAIQFSAGPDKTDIVVIPLHMKADYKGDYSSQRELEARELTAELAKVRDHFGDEDIVIIGDLNCGNADEPALEEFGKAGFRDLNAKDTATHVEYGPLDRVLVPRQDEFLFSRMYILTAADQDQFDRYLSDHQIILIPIRVLPDDDP